MALTETTDCELLCRIFASEIATAEAAGAIVKGRVSPPTAGGLSICFKAGDFGYIDPTQPRVACWCHPLTKTEVAVMHLWGPSAIRDQAQGQLARALQAKGFLTVRWAPENTYGQSAKTQMGASTVTNQDGTVSISLATAIANWTAKGV